MAGIVEDGGWRGSRWRIAMWGAAAFLLALPAIAMQFTDEMKWDETDFIVIGTMLLAACGTFELAARASGSWAYRAGVAIAIAAAFLLIWINLAVGIIGSEDNPANLMFGGVIAVGIVGAIVARFQPQGMARAMTVTAIAQALVAVVALLMGQFTFILIGFFVAMWLLSAWLFRKAAQARAPA